MGEPEEKLTITELLQDLETGELTLARGLQLFETIYLPSRNLADRTRKEYGTDIRQLVDFLAAAGLKRVEETRLTHLQGFLAHLYAEGCSDTTRRRKTSTVKSFFSFLKTNNLIIRSPAEQLIPPEREYPEPRFLTHAELKRLRQTYTHHTRDAALVDLMLGTGIKLSEVTRLTVHDIDLPDGSDHTPVPIGHLVVSGKSRRILPLDRRTCQCVQAWLDERPETDSAALFVTKFGDAMGPRAVQRTVKKYLKQADIEQASAHTLRHTYAVYQIGQGTSIAELQKALGHADSRTTSVYRNVSKPVGGL